ncbi:hypothetical protein [Rhabdochromatium marinum]|uniref:hypothetical protein n=1 Tax=Rhabdochromatium marinum TaxID=48729 RepID=UPI0019070687|nr:hypothetical protein [Rhabdochromatium marinum]MBK1648450.1 hypothetical protein [Rhabdochromatium marinum]
MLKLLKPTTRTLLLAPLALIPAPLALLLGGCLASSPSIDANESYRGALNAAILPMNGEVDQLTGWMLRHELEDHLAKRIRASQIFASVQELTSATAPNEAEILIEPSFLQQTSLPERHSDQAELAIHLRVRKKTNGTIALDRDYRVPCPQCGQGIVDPQAVQALSTAISRDLQQQFRHH